MSGSESGRLREAPKVSNLRVRGQEAGTDFGPSPVRRKAGSSDRRAANRRRGGFGPGSVGQDRVSARELRSGRPRTQVHGLPGRPEASAQGVPAKGGTGLRLRIRRRRGGGTPVPHLPRRTARASALTGSRRGNRKGRKLWKDPGRSAARAPGSGVASKQPSGLPRLPGLVSNRDGTVGAGGDVSPHYF